MSAASDGDGNGTSTGVGNALTTLVPSFDPSKDSLQVYTQKVELVLAAWPKTKVTELVMRLILNSQGSAFAKLQLHQAELLENDEKSVRKLIELLGGHWGRIGLERQYEEAEQALFNTTQMKDESNDSYLARADIAWSKFLAQKLSMQDLQAFVLLRGSTLTPEEKKRVILESDNSLEGKLTVQRVSESVRILGATFFHEMTGLRTGSKQKVYSSSTLVAEHDEDDEQVFQTQDEATEEDFVEALLLEGDSDAALVTDFEAAASDLLQDDSDLATAYSAYTEARRRLTEKFKNRGFWSTSKSSFSSAKGKFQNSKGGSKGKNSWSQRPKRSLQDRILNSYCRNCNRKGHWKAECPYRQNSSGSAAASTTPSTMSGSMPTTTVSIDNAEDVMPLEFMQLPVISQETIDDTVPVYVSFCETFGGGRSSYQRVILGESDGDRLGIEYPSSARERLQAWGFRNESQALRDRARAQETLNRRLLHRVNSELSHHAEMPTGSQKDSPAVSSVQKPAQHPNHIRPTEIETACFASHGSHGILDLGASKTVIGSHHLGDLIRSLDESIRSRLSRCPCHIVFKFGNQSTLTSEEALVVPLGHLKLKIAIVPGGTPFLISNTLMRKLQAKIDCATQTMSSVQMAQPVSLQLTAKGLFLLDLNELIKATMDRTQSSHRAGMQGCAETYVSDETESKSQSQPGPVGFRQGCMSPYEKHDTSWDQKENKDQPDEKPIQKHVKTAVRAQSAELPAVSDQNARPVSHVPVSEASQSADSDDSSGNGELGPSHTRGPIVRGGVVWPEVQRQHLCGHLAGPRVGPFHDQPISEQSEGSSPTLSEVRGTQDRVLGAVSDDHPKGAQCQKPSPEQSKGHGKTHCHAFRHLFAGWRDRMGHRTRDVRPSDYGESCHSVGRGRSCDAAKDVESGECFDQGDPPSREPELPGVQCPPGGGPVREDWDDTVLTAMHHEASYMKQMIQQFSNEFDEVLKTTKPLGNPWDLAEVMCSENSPLTQQMLQLGKKAFRFGLAQGDLSQSSGRRELFQMMARHRPRHTWYSPTCGPWSAWSQLNSSKSLHHYEEYQQKRGGLLYQIALGVVLYRFQISRGNHFHWEQPKRSLMFQSHHISEVHQHTQACQFDMCRAGDLKDPESGMPMQKGMTVLTSFAPLFQRLHGMSCDHRHQHQPIEGSCKVSNNQSMLRTQFTEIYPRKFARNVAVTLGKGNVCWPYNWKAGMICMASSELNAQGEDNALVATKFRKQPQFPKSAITTPTARMPVGAKRSKTDSHQGNAPTLEMCKEALQEVNKDLPRVGKREITNPSILVMLQNIFPDKSLHRVMACRGTDRTMAPPAGMHPQEAPFRRMLIMKRTGETQYETYWERWPELAKRQLIRPSHSCRINVTVFAKDNGDRPPGNNPGNNPEMGDKPLCSQGSSQDQSEGPLHVPPSAAPPVVSEVISSDQPEVTDKGVEEPPVNPTVPDGSERPTGQEDPRAMLEIVQRTHATDPPEVNAKQQGFRFNSLPRWEQQTILRMHKNLGHPSNDRLAKALQVNGARAEVVQAALEIRCATCSATSPPKHARPSTLKSMLDFNHKIYLDGITWTNRMNKTFHFYHILDAGTNFHIAIVSPSKTTEDLIKLISQHWISWAGPPSEITVDSATEMNSKEFSLFLQRFCIKSTTTVPEAHWQSGRIERHGGFLQCMLEKVDYEHPINDYGSLQMALNQCTHAKNALSIRHGYAPEVIVFGKHSRIPGSILSDESIPAHELANKEDHSLSSQEFRHMLSVRETARRAYHMADNHEVLRRAALRRACPSRGQFSQGDWVMIWRENPLKQLRWQGPHRVVIQDANHTVWCTSNGQLYRSAPENTRLAFPEEGSPEGPELPEDVTPLLQQINRMQNNPNNPPEQNDIPSELSSNANTSNPINPNGPESNNSSSHINTPESISNDSQDESIPQPDQEPENVTPEPSQANNPDQTAETDHSGQIAGGTELVQLACHEEENALTCEAITNAAWKCEFGISRQLEPGSSIPSEEETWIMLATSAKKQRTEVKLSTLTPEEIQEFEKAKESEIQNWVKTSTISTILRNQIPEEQILKCRWILTWKPLDNVGQSEESSKPTKSHKAKARLVVLGYLDPRIEEIPRDSPTLNKTSRMIALQVISSHMWKLRSFDIKAAFLQGQPQADRVIAVDPVPELRKALSMKPHEICKLNKSAYGLIDAPYLWYCALVSELLRLGFETSPFDPYCFVLRSPSSNGQPGKLEGILGVHVDDGIGGGSEVFEAKIRELEKTFAFGSHKISAFTFTGIEVTQHGDYSITLSQSSYVRKINPISIECNRKSQLDLPVTEPERLALRGVIGSLQYAAINTRPDLSSKLSFLQSAINVAKIETLMEANKVLHEAKRHHDVTITIKPIPPQNFRLMAFSDASFSSAKKPDSHADQSADLGLPENTESGD